MEEKESNFIEESRREFMKIGHVECPAFDNEKIYFTNKGFKHLLYKQREYRSFIQQKRRIFLLKYVPGILATSEKHYDYREVKGKIETKCGTKESIVRFWSFCHNLGNEKIIVVVRQINSESKHFFSVMNKK